MRERLTKKEIISRSKEIHGDNYDFSKMIYEGNKVKFKIVCKVDGHGSFDISPHHFLSGHGCPKCGSKRTGDSKRIELAGEKFGKLKVIKQSEIPAHRLNGKKSKVFWLVQCSCGREPFSITTDALMSGQKSCKVCFDRQSGLKKDVNNWKRIKGQRYGKLEVFKDWGRNRYGSRRVLCICDCGNQTITEFSNLHQGKTKSCGCVPKGEDSYSGFKNNEEWANSDCRFYVADVDNQFIKPGISNDLAQRLSHGKYKGYLYQSPEIKRCEAWTIEQLILLETKDASPSLPPHSFKGDGGIHELRLRDIKPPVFYQQRFLYLLDKLRKSNWENLYLSEFQKL